MKRIFYLSIMVILCVQGFQLYGQSSIESLLAGKIDIIVAADGSGDFTSVQEAINSVSDYNPDTTVIFIRNGFYYEKINIPYTKENITMIGENVDSTILSHDDYPAIMPDNSTWGTYSFRADAENFTAMNLTFENTAGAVGQALAFSSFGDKQILYHCRFLGYQDTYYVNYRARNYMKDCFIEGAVDYIYGFGITVFDSCQIHTTRNGGVITASAASIYNRYGLIFRDCRLTTPSGIGGIYLGRPWQSRPHVAYLDCYEPSSVASAGWTSMSSGKNPIFAEYNCSGPGYLPDSRSTNENYPGIQLTPEQAADYYILDSVFAVTSFAEPDEAQAEIDEMFKPFYDANLVELITGVMNSGRDSFVDVPDDDWNPMLEENEFYMILSKELVPFMDSSWMTAPIVENILVGGTPLENFDPGTTLYGIEMEEGQTVAPVVEVVSQNSHVRVEYPESVPAYTTVNVYSLDFTTLKSYKIYNSVDSMFWDADLVFLGFNRTDTVPLVPGVYSYDIEVPNAVTAITSFQVKKSQSSATYTYEKPEAIPGQGTVTVTSMGKTVVNVYELNFTHPVGVDIYADQTQWMEILSPAGEEGLLRLGKPETGAAVVKVYSLTGARVANISLEVNSADQLIPVNLASLQEGLYFYSVDFNNQIFSGKFLKL